MLSMECKVHVMCRCDGLGRNEGERDGVSAEQMGVVEGWGSVSIRAMSCWLPGFAD